MHNEYGFVNVWQRGYHEHIIRDVSDYEKIAQYISENPLKCNQIAFIRKNNNRTTCFKID